MCLGGAWDEATDLSSTTFRYNTKHFNDEATPKTTKTMLST